MGIRWQFVEMESADQASWTWRALHPDGSLRTSPQPLRSYGAAVHDAIRHGFMPSEHDWSVTSGRSVVEYHYDDDPAIVTSRRVLRRTAARPQPPPSPTSRGSGSRRRR